MNKELKALKEVRECLYGDVYAGVEKRLDIIETALKEYELMKQTKYIVADKKPTDEDLKKLINQRMFVTDLTQCEIKALYDEETRNKLKALEIIKEKEVDVGWFNRATSLYHYNMGMGIKSYGALTQKEYDLLKEVLL